MKIYWWRLDLAGSEEEYAAIADSEESAKSEVVAEMRRLGPGWYRIIDLLDFEQNLNGHWKLKVFDIKPGILPLYEVDA